VKAAPDNVEKRASWATFPYYRWFGIKLSPLFGFASGDSEQAQQIISNTKPTFH
jgi:hypothetical protein